MLWRHSCLHHMVHSVQRVVEYGTASVFLRSHGLRIMNGSISCPLHYSTSQTSHWKADRPHVCNDRSLSLDTFWEELKTDFPVVYCSELILSSFNTRTSTPSDHKQGVNGDCGHCKNTCWFHSPKIVVMTRLDCFWAAENYVPPSNF